MEIDERELVLKTDGVTRDVARTAAAHWFEQSQRRLMEEAAGTNLHPIAQSATPPEWDADREGYVFSYPHVAAIYHEFGAEPHEIRARNAEFLAFEWHDAPPEIREQFSETFPTVFFKKVNHPGVPERRFVRDGRDAAAQYLRTKGAQILDESEEELLRLEARAEETGGDQG